MTIVYKALTIVIIGAGWVLTAGETDTANSPKAKARGGLEVKLVSAKANYLPGEQVQLTSTFTNVGKTPLSLTFWWNRSLRIADAQGNIVPPGKGPELPCGVAETPLELEPGKTLSRGEPLQCTQPAGLHQQVGWSYTLKPGTYRIALVHQYPPPHGYGVNNRPGAWKGTVTSNEVTFTIGR